MARNGATMHHMHYHYFTIEQRDILVELMRARSAEPGMEGALKRFHTPEFGVCETCGDDIPFVQLRTNPRLTHCARCAPGQ
jgi:RNA polymerase-binding transcription factor DksA